MTNSMTPVQSSNGLFFQAQDIQHAHAQGQEPRTVPPDEVWQPHWRRIHHRREGNVQGSLRKNAQVSIKATGAHFVHQALFLCAPFLPNKGNVHLFSSSLPRFDKCHQTSRIFPRSEQTFASARSFGVISWASFFGKMAPLALGGFSKSPLKVKRATFPIKRRSRNVTKTPGTGKCLLSPRKYSWSLVAFGQSVGVS